MTRVTPRCDLLWSVWPNAFRRSTSEAGAVGVNPRFFHHSTLGRGGSIIGLLYLFHIIWNFLFDLENGTGLACSRHSETIIIESTPDGLPPARAQPEIVPDSSALLQHVSLPQPRCGQIPVLPWPLALYPVRNGSSAIRPSTAPNHRRFRCIS